MAMGIVEQHAQALLKNTADNSQPLIHHISNPSAISTMIPAPGMPHNGSTSSLVSYSAENSMVSTSGAGLMASTTVSMVDFQATTDGLAEYSASFSTCNGLASNGYQQLPNNVALGSSGNDVMSSMNMKREQSQMIPTPGLNNLQQVSMNPECSNGGGLFSTASTLVSQQQQHQLHQSKYIGSQNSRLLHSPGGNVGVGMSSNMHHKASAYGFTNGVMNGGLGLFGSSIQLLNGPIGSEGNHCSASYGSENLYGPASVAPTMSNHNLNRTSLLPKPRSNSGPLTHYARLNSMQQIPPILPQVSDHSHNMNFQPAHPSREHTMQAQHQMQSFQLQQLNQQPIQSYSQFVQQQHRRQLQQESMQQQQLVPMADSMRQSPMTSTFGGQLISELGIDSHNDLFIPHAAEQLHLSEIQSYSLQNTSCDHSKDTELLGCASGLQEFQPSFSQHPCQQVNESQNDFSCLKNGSQPKTFCQGDLHQSIQRAHVSHKLPFQQQVQEESHIKITGKDEAQQPHMSLEGCIPGRAAARRMQQSSSRVSSARGNYTGEQDYLKQMRWLLLLLHARGCRAPKGVCKEPNCIRVQQLCTHMVRCNSSHCGFPRCSDSKKLYDHYRACRTTTCPLCVPLRKYIDHKTNNQAGTRLPNAINDPSRSTNVVDGDKMISNIGASSAEVHEDPQSLSKRMKLQHDLPSSVPNKETSPDYVRIRDQSHASQELQPLECEKTNVTTHVKSEVIGVEIDTSQGNGHGHSHPPADRTNDVLDNARIVRPDAEPLCRDQIDIHAKQEIMVVEKESDQTKMEVKHEANALPLDPASGSKSGKPEIKGVSLTELFTPEQVREHILGLRQWIGQSKAKAEKNQAMERSMNENSCQLCAVEKLTFEPPPIYCTPCGARIKRNAMYYTMGSGDTRHYFCIPCYNETRGDTIEVEGSAFPKARLEKKKNDEETEEWWVQCDKCEAWQHQICALFNGRRNDGGQAEYTCPNCYIKEVERGERKPLPQSAVLGAKDLPRTILSDQIEERLFIRLKQEREERARHLGKAFDEVPGAEGLVIRVVSSVDKKLEVKQRFLEIFQEENYPTEFPYKSKVILLFQKIEGVEVCLFGMYLQEFGSESHFPNQRRVYLSYLDSVKYFRPEIRTVTGEALRTFVYHEILIGYLDYCKKRGFTSCYIWACPPLKGEDYILYCHPEIQKTPKSDKLREWYLSMLRKAAKENIVADLTNLYDHFFVTVGECKAKVTAARLPYFDGDYWPGAAEDMINQLRQEEDGKKLQKKGKTKKILTKRALKAAGHADLSGNASKDALLMQKLGETICPMKEDFIMVHLQHACTHCCLLMVSGKRWVCKQCKNFQLCDKCHDAEERLEDRDRHPLYNRDKHMLFPVEINDVPSDTKDKDEVLESEFFDTRQAFLSLCQGNHYQYDTLRRAKHSSMMVLYHLHNPTAPAFVTPCNVCHHDIEAGQGWRCEICPDYDVCHACYQKNGGSDHPHKLTNHPSMAERDAQNKEARQKRVLQLRKMLDLLVHASQCRFPHCQYPNCRKVKGLFRHGIQCKTRASGGCPLCKKMWYLLQLHARACKESGCHVPRCRDLREHLKRMQQQSESRRRAAVMEMMRQRAAEVTGNGE